MAQGSDCRHSFPATFLCLSRLHPSLSLASAETAESTNYTGPRALYHEPCPSISFKRCLLEIFHKNSLSLLQIFALSGAIRVKCLSYRISGLVKPDERPIPVGPFSPCPVSKEGRRPPAAVKQATARCQICQHLDLQLPILQNCEKCIFIS